MTRSRGSFFAILAILGSGQLLAACGADAASAELEASGVLSFPLVTTTPNGAQYRLANARIQYTGPVSGYIEVGENQDLQTALKEVPTGTYTITLLPGWQMQLRNSAGNYENVRAVLASSATSTVTVSDQQTATVVIRFRVGENVIEFGNGRIGVSIVVDEETAGVCTPGQTRCVADAPSLVEACSSTGTAWVPQSACGAGTTCQDGACVAAERCQTTLPNATGGEPDGLIPVCCTPSAGNAVEVAKLVSLLNTYRTTNGLGTLTVDPALAAASQGHSIHMRLHPFFSHVAPETAVASFTDRPALCGANASQVGGEILASGDTDPAAILPLWQQSAIHNSVILTPAYRRVGVGMSEGYWTVSFGN